MNIMTPRKTEIAETGSQGSAVKIAATLFGSIQPPNLHLAPWRFGTRCTTCRSLELKDGEYWCTRYDITVSNGALCDDYVGWEDRVT